MFARESEMATSAAAWLKSCGMAVRSEFVTPWGICDLVGIRFNSQNVAHTLQQRQTRAVGSITRAALLLQIPDAESKQWTTSYRLVCQFAPLIPKDVVLKETDRLIADRFVVSSFRGHLQKVNGWMPLQERLIAVELKLSRVEEAMRQALNNLGFAEESFIGLPEDVAHRVSSNQARWSEFFNYGIGIISVAKGKCKVLVEARKTQDCADKTIQFYCVEKFWRTRLKTTEH